MTTPEVNIRTVQSFFTALQAKDATRVTSFLTEDVDWRVGEDAVLPFLGPRHGPQGVMDYFRIAGEYIAMGSVTPGEWTAQGDRVALEGVTTSAVRATGKSFTVHWAMLFTLREGKIARYRHYLDTTPVLQAWQQQ
ncbi:MAG: nuclear transport factor 2 family protein [Dehalococcoidia bacterium]|nr:nuclear transport factor 2 family protein [Dehalococcoidia bacterium]